MRLKTDCAHYLGSRPCGPAKAEGAQCPNCERYVRRGKAILIIKLGASGDVLRTTFLLPHLKRKFGPGSELVWLASNAALPVLAQNPFISRTLDSDAPGALAVLQSRRWDAAYCLDNSPEAAAFCAMTKARAKHGFTMPPSGAITPLDAAAARWLELACCDTLKKNNTLSYQELMLAICGLQGEIGRPIFTPSPKAREKARAFFARHAKGKTIIGLNTGAGTRWPRKMLEPRDTAALCRKLLAEDKKYAVALLGGPGQEAAHKLIASSVRDKRLLDTGTRNSFDYFAALLGCCNAAISGDTLALHTAAATGTPCVAVFGPTSKDEIYDYDGLILKLDAGLPCQCCYGDCGKTRHCMNTFDTDALLSAVLRQLAFKRDGRGK